MAKTILKAIGKNLGKMRKTFGEISVGRVIKFILYAIYLIFLLTFCLPNTLRILNNMSKCDFSGYCTSPGDLHLDWYKHDGSTKSFCWKNWSTPDGPMLIKVWSHNEDDWIEYDLNDWWKRMRRPYKPDKSDELFANFSELRKRWRMREEGSGGGSNRESGEDSGVGHP